MRTGWLKTMADALRGLMFPRCCPVCRRALSDGEPYVCRQCMDTLPRLNHRPDRMNEVEEVFVGSRVVTRAFSLFRYHRSSDYAGIIKEIKLQQSSACGVLRRTTRGRNGPARFL